MAKNRSKIKISLIKLKYSLSDAEFHADSEYRIFRTIWLEKSAFLTQKRQKMSKIAGFFSGFDYHDRWSAQFTLIF